MTQAPFARAVMDPDLAVPADLTDPQGRPAGKRFAVYRNNVAVSLTEALATAFPVTQKIVGAEFFAVMAGVYLRAHPPASPLMMFYGEALPGFLASFPPSEHLGYLPDIARLELALRQSYHAADATALPAATLQALSPDRFMAARFTLAPSVRLIRSKWPIHAIWRTNTDPNPPAMTMRAEDVLVTRPGFDPVPHVLPERGGILIDALMRGETFAKALNRADETDLTQVLGLLIAGGAITAISEETPS